MILDVSGSQVENIAIDWIAENIYWTSQKTKLIEVARLNGSYRYVLIHENLDNPRAIVIDPRVGYLFWSDNDDTARIERAALDGTERQVIYTTLNMGFISDLVIDYNRNKLIWCDQYNSIIMQSNYDGVDLETIAGHTFKLFQPFSIDYKDEVIYWIEQSVFYYLFITLDSTVYTLDFCI